MVVKAINNFSYHDLSYICVSLSQYLEFVGKLLCSALCTYSRVFDTPVPQAFVCDTSEEANLVLKQIYPHCRCITHLCLKVVNSFNHHFKHLLTNTRNFWINSFVPYFIHIVKSFPHPCLKVLSGIHLQLE